MTLNPSPRCLLRAAFAILLCIAAMLPVSALTSGDFSYTATAAAATITGYSGTGGAVTIPSTINGLPVVGIGNNVFNSRDSLTSVTIPASVTSIGGSAFINCTSLTNVAIGSSVTSIGNNAFSFCTSLTAITVNSLNSVYSSVDGVLFNKSQTTLIQCPGAKVGSYSIPASVTSIGDYAFSNCTSLNSVTIPTSVTIIVAGTFSSCTILTSVTIPASVTSIGASAFYDCISLTSVTIPASVTSIETNAFANCYSLTSIYFRGNAPTTDGDYIFSNSYSLKRVFYSTGTTGWKPLFSRLPTTLWIPLNITRQPSSASLNQGNTAIFGVMATGNALSYQWQKDGLDIPGATSELLFLSNVQPGDAASYAVVVSDDTGSVTSSAAVLTVNGPPIVTVHPVSMTVSQGGGVTFSVTATGASGYQWQKNGSNLTGANSETLALSELQTADAGSYAVIVSNATGSVSSNSAVLTVNAPFTQAQYDEVLQAGRNQVINAPNSYGLYNLTQMQALNVGAPLLAKDPVSGKFKLTIAAKKSIDLSTYTPLPFSEGTATINAQGEMEFLFTSPDNAAFFRLESK